MRTPQRRSRRKQPWKRRGSRTARVVFLLALFVVIVIAIIIRLAYWAIAGPPVAPRPSGSAEPLRSRIVDSTSLLLATDNFSTEVYARPQGIQVREDRAQLEAKIATALGQPEESIRAGLAVTLTQVTLLKDADPKQRAAIRALKLPGLVWADDVRVRRYPMGQLGAHLVGFTNQQREGRYGVEASYDDWLWGKRDADLQERRRERSTCPKPGGATCRHLAGTTWCSI